MSAEEKQTYLREEIIEKGHDAELFISFLEEKRENGANISTWSLEELKEMVEDFIEENTKGSIVRRMTDNSTKLNVFGDHEIKTGETEEKDDEDDEDNKSEESDDTYENYGKEVTHPQGEAKDSSDEEEEKENEEGKKEKSSSSSSDGDENKEGDDNKDDLDEMEMKDDDDDEDDKDQKESKYYSKRTVATYISTQLVDQMNIDVDVSNPEIVKGRGLKGSYTVYTIKTSPFDWIVKRRYSDFEWLHSCLVKRFTANYVKNLLNLTLDSCFT